MLVGQDAPDFTLKAIMPDNTLSDVTLSSFRGQYVVLFFYDANFGAVSSTEVAGFETLVGDFAKRHCVVFGVSPDSESSHQAWKLMPTTIGGVGNVSFPLLSDPHHEVAMKYGSVLPNKRNCRSVFLIDCKGIVQAETRNNLPVGANYEEMLRLLDAFQYHEQSMTDKEKVIPAGWIVGQEAMFPSIEGIVEFNRVGGLNRYVSKPTPPGILTQTFPTGDSRVMYMAPLMSICTEKPKTPQCVKVNKLRAANQAETRHVRASVPDYFSHFARVADDGDEFSPVASPGRSKMLFGGYRNNDPFKTPITSENTSPLHGGGSVTWQKSVSNMWTV